jgi:hypothetical protein
MKSRDERLKGRSGDLKRFTKFTDDEIIVLCSSVLLVLVQKECLYQDH